MVVVLSMRANHLRTDNSIAIADNGLDAADVDILNIRAGSFTNTGVLNANILNLNVVGDFDYTQRGIINTTTFNLEVDGVFSNNDASIGFVWEESDTLTVSGNANITALNFINHGAINVADSGSSGSFEITTGYTAINQGSIVKDPSIARDVKSFIVIDRKSTVIWFCYVINRCLYCVRV